MSSYEAGVNRQHDRAAGDALEYVADSNKAQDLLVEARRKATKNRSSLERVWHNLTTLLRLVSSWASGEYTRVPWVTVALATGALLYLVNPFDAMPDFIPGLGYVDDATVISLVILSIKENLAQFQRWCETKNKQPTA